MFTCLPHQIYNKAPLIQINMCSHWGKHAPQLYTILRNYTAIFDEYLVENTHSILHSKTKGSDSADELRKRAKSIFQSKGKQSDYRSFFITPRQFSFSHNQLRLLKVRCAQALSSMFIKISQSQFSSNNSCNTSVPTHVILPTMSPNKNMKMTVYLQGIAMISSQIKQKNVIYLCVTCPAKMRIGPSCMVVFIHSFHDVCLDGSTS